MDAQAHLLSLGWAGPGHALDSRPYKQKGHRGLAYDPSQVRSTGNGLIKPLLISQRQGRLGIGKRAHEPQAGNDWWLKGFESALGNIGKSESERSSGTSTPDPLAHKGKHTGLYGFFVRGQTIEGTIGSVESKSKKRKSDVLEEDSPNPPKSKKQKDAADFENVGAFIAERDKDERRRHRKAKATAVEEFKQAEEFFGAISPRKADKNLKEQTRAADEDEDEATSQPETKEQRRERRRKRKEEKAARRAAESEDQSSMDDAAAKAARRAERKRRKAEKLAQAN